MTHREMIPGGKLLGIALVSTQKALSLVQEQVAGQRGVFGALLASASPGRQRHRADKHISPVHLRPSSGIVGRNEPLEVSAQRFVARRRSAVLMRGGGREGGRGRQGCSSAHWDL